MRKAETRIPLMPAKVGIQKKNWVPAKAGTQDRKSVV